MYLHNIDTKYLHYSYTTYSKTHNYTDKYITEYIYIFIQHTNMSYIYMHVRTNLHKSFLILCLGYCTYI